jgi:hypothetical protein
MTITTTTTIDIVDGCDGSKYANADGDDLPRGGRRGTAMK